MAEKKKEVQDMNAEKLRDRYHMQPHVENGSFCEVHYPFAGPGRAASGSIYYYVAPGERTKFHVIDCDEYWCFTAGSSLEVWMISPEGQLTVQMLGQGEMDTPLIYVPAGTVFASKHCGGEEGTFLTCITVPRFDPAGFRIVEKEQLLPDYPQLLSF